MGICRGCGGNIALEDMFGGQEVETWCRDTCPLPVVCIEVGRMLVAAWDCAASRKSAVGDHSGQAGRSDLQTSMMSDADVGPLGGTLSLMDEEKETCPQRSRVVVTLKEKGGCEEEEAQTSSIAGQRDTCPKNLRW